MNVKGIIWVVVLLAFHESHAQFKNLTQRNTLLNESNTITACSALKPDLSIRNIYIDQENNKYLSTKSEGIIMLQDCNSSTETFLEAAQSYYVSKDSQNTIWAATSGNQLVNTATKARITLPVAEGETYINFVHFGTHYIWVGTLTHGLILLQSNGELPTSQDPLAKIIRDQLNTQSIEVYDCLSDEKGNTWLATGQGLFIIPAAQREGRFIEALNNKVIKSLTRDRETLWLSTLNELWTLNVNTLALSKVSLPQNPGVIEDLVLDQNQHLWIAADVVARYTPRSQTLRVYDNAKGFKSRKAVCLAVDQQNTIWVGTSGSGTFVIKQEKNRSVSTNFIQTFEKTTETLNSTQIAEKVNIVQISYQFHSTLENTPNSPLRFILHTPSDKRIQLRETGVSENYGNRSFVRNFRIDEQLAPGKYTLEVIIQDSAVDNLEFELY